MLQVKSQMINVEERTEEIGGRSQESEKKPGIGNRGSERQAKKSGSSEDMKMRSSGENNLNLGEKESLERCEQIKNSRIINLNRVSIRKTVYLMDDSEMVIRVDDRFLNLMKSRDKHILQVFMDGWIKFEQYLSKVKDEEKVKLEGKEWEKVEVEVKIR